jgi:hypothetical protein
MSTIGRINRETAKHLPATQYDHPSQIVTETMLTRGEKIATLQRWRQQIVDELAAGDDGMPTQRTSGRSHDLLTEITAAIDALAAAPER